MDVFDSTAERSVLRLKTGLRSYDPVELRGIDMGVTNTFVASSMSSLKQVVPPSGAEVGEILVPPAPGGVLCTRLSSPTTIPCRIAGRPRTIHPAHGFHIWLPAGIDSYWQHSSASAFNGWFHLHFSPEALLSAAEEHGKAIDHCLMQVDDSLCHLVQTARALTADQRPNLLLWDSLAQLVLYRLSVLSRDHRKESRSERLSPWQCRIAIDFITDHFDQQIQLKDVASVVELSPFHFARAFRATVGHLPHRYQTMIRMDRAKCMLLETRLSILDVSVAVGYNSAVAFNRAFKPHVGVSPSVFRRDNRSRPPGH